MNSADQDRLEACPFCGSPGYSRVHEELPDSFMAGCSDPDCIASAVAFDFVSEESARNAWNRRPLSVARAHGDEGGSALAKSTGAASDDAGASDGSCQSEWRTIDTAPKDGTWFVALQDGLIYPCEWRETESDEGPGYTGWWDHFNSSFEEPTHWAAVRAPLSAVSTSPLADENVRLREALKAADEALAQFTAFEDDARHIMGNTNFAIVQSRREQVRTALSTTGAGSDEGLGSSSANGAAGGRQGDGDAAGDALRKSDGGC